MWQFMMETLAKTALIWLYINGCTNIIFWNEVQTASFVMVVRFAVFLVRVARYWSRVDRNPHLSHSSFQNGCQLQRVLLLTCRHTIARA